MKTIGVIDIGSNSMRLVMARINEEGYLKIFDELKEFVRLGQDITATGELDEARLNHAIEVLKFFKSICNSNQADEIIAVATAAVRNAPNSQDFIDRVKTEAGIDIRIISGIEEAYYDYFSTINSIDISDCMIIDIGGSSTELIYIQDRKMINSISIPMGAINLSYDFQLLDVIDKEKETELNDFIYNNYSNVSWLKDVKDVPLVAIGGTARNIGKIDKKSKNYPLDLTHRYSMTFNDLRSIYDSIMTTDIKKRKKIKGLSKDRADIFPGALAAIYALMESLDLEELIISGRGIREGILYEYLLKDEPVDDVLEYSLITMLTNHNMKPSHGKEIWNLSKKLFDDLRPVHNIEPEVNDVNIYKVLKTAAYLHDIGIATSYYDHHKHSFYMVVNTNLNGLTQKEFLMAAYTTSLHRKDEVQINKAHYKSIIDDEDINIIRKLGILLRISEQLDRRSNNNILELTCAVQEEIAIIKVIAKEDPSIEINNAIACASDFQKLYGKKLIIV